MARWLGPEAEVTAVGERHAEQGGRAQRGDQVRGHRPDGNTLLATWDQQVVERQPHGNLQQQRQVAEAEAMRCSAVMALRSSRSRRRLAASVPSR